MIAYFVHNPTTQTDVIVMPDMACAVAVDRKMIEAFISPAPVFAEWSGDACANVSPEDFGSVAATRDEQGDICVIDEDLWRKRLDSHMTRDK